jgi:hypothetical protein
MKTPQSTFQLALLATVLFLCGCNTRAKFEDASDNPASSSYVGAGYLLKVPMHISGVNLPPGYRKVVDIYSVNPAASTLSGPEIVTQDTLPPGTLIVVDSVHRCTNCIFGERVEARIRIPGYKTQVDRPIKISLKHLEPQYVEKTEKPNQSLQPTAPSGRG